MQLPVMDEMIEQVRVPSIAEWRWSTLNTAVDVFCRRVAPRCCRHMSTRIYSRTPEIPLHLPGAMVPHIRLLGRGHSICAWFTLWICCIQRWGRGGACHSDEPECKLKARRLRDAAVFVDRELCRGLQEAESWTEETFQTTVSEHLDFVRCVGASCHIAGKKFAYLQKLQWQSVRIFEPSIKAQSMPMVCLRTA